MQLRARQFSFTFPSPALIMGIVNATPDSFSDGGSFMDVEKAVDHALEMEADGAAIIDIGGESTRPGATPVSEGEELRRVMPIIERLRGRLCVPISIDTMKERVARESVAAGASIINDVGSNQRKPGMWNLAAETGCAYVVMHMQGTPQTMQNHPHYSDVAGEVHDFLESKVRELSGCGVAPEQIIIDPGIGFGKTAAHNVKLLAGLGGLLNLGRPLLVGVSRKSFLAGRDMAPPLERLPAGLACACMAVERGAGIIRAHEVKETLRAVRMTETILTAEREQTSRNG